MPGCVILSDNQLMGFATPPNLPVLHVELSVG